MTDFTILVVTDDNETGSLLTRLLEKHFSRTLIATGVEDGARLFTQVHPDITVIDLLQHGPDGLYLAERIRNDSPKTKITLLTNFDNKQQLLKANRIGIDHLLAKPVEREHLLRTLIGFRDEIVEKRAMDKALKRQKNILDTINTMAEHFLQHADWEEALRRQMLSLKSAAEASAIFIFQNESSDDPQVAREYLTINDDPHAMTPRIISYRSLDIMPWKRRLQNGKSVKGLIDDFRASEQHLLYDYRINSLLMLPIFFDSSWWGFMGIGNCDGRRFDAIDARTLDTVARIIGSAINNQYNLRNLEMTSTIFKHTVDGVVITDAENRIVHTNDAFTEITGFSAEEVKGKNPRILRSAAHDKKFYKSMWEQISQKGYWQGEIKNRNKKGEIYLEWLSINAITNGRGEIENYIAVFSDITTHRADDAEYAYLATHDALTGLSNRLILNDRLEHAITHARRFDKMVGVLFCDLDNFKPINDTYGHRVGDGVLKQCADYFKATLRSDDTICRYGGDEFVIILEDLDEIWHLGTLVEKIMDITTMPFNIEGHRIDFQMSVGVSVFPFDGEDVSLIERADQAMYKAKNGGKNRFALYNEALLYSSNPDFSEHDFNFSI